MWLLLCKHLHRGGRGRYAPLAAAVLLLADELAAYGVAGSRLFFSGLLVEQVEEVMARYASLGLYPVHRREQEGWVALELGRSEPCEGRE